MVARLPPPLTAGTPSRRPSGASYNGLQSNARPSRLPKDHASRTEEPRHHSRSGGDPGPALHRHELTGRCLPPPPREMRLPDRDASRVPHPRIVPREETVKGYETAKDEYVRFEPEELKALEQESSSALVINWFVPETAVDPCTSRRRTTSARVIIASAAIACSSEHSNRRTGRGRHVHLARQTRPIGDPAAPGGATPARSGLASPPAAGMRQTFQGEGRCLNDRSGERGCAGGRPGHRTSAERGGGRGRSPGRGSRSTSLNTAGLPLRSGAARRTFAGATR